MYGEGKHKSYNDIWRLVFSITGRKKGWMLKNESSCYNGKEKHRSKRS